MLRLRKIVIPAKAGIQSGVHVPFLLSKLSTGPFRRTVLASGFRRNDGLSL
ncbi:MAG: hypothetical protein LHV69_04400 [Elusimicrobia bacterium]|nr:hypothetical protein [Candidatus Obscuribacterium magneticum]